MGFFTKFLKKLIPFREAITIAIIGFRIAWFASAVVFFIAGIDMFVTIYGYIKQLMDMSATNAIAGSDSLNDYSQIAWAMLHSFGVVDVLNTFLPLIFSNLAFYLTYAGMKIMIDLKDKVINEMRRMANLGLGSS